MVSEGHRTVSPPKIPSFGTLGQPNTSGGASTSKGAGTVLMGDRPNSLESGVNLGVALAGLRSGHLKMDMPPVFTASKQQNVRG